MSNDDQAVAQDSDQVKVSMLDAILAKSKDEFIPWEDCQLPSRGLYYDDLVPEGKIQVKAMNMFVEKAIATPRIAQSGQSFDYIYKHCVKFPNEFDSKETLRAKTSNRKIKLCNSS